MAQAFVFPGGARDGAEDLRVTAARSRFEEAGVLLADGASRPRSRRTCGGGRPRASPSTRSCERSG